MPREVKTSGSTSMIQLFEESGYLNHKKQITEKAIEKYLLTLYRQRKSIR